MYTYFKSTSRLLEYGLRDTLQSKHPDQSEPHPDAFVVCDVLPTLIEVDVTAEHVQKVAKNLSGGAGVSGLDAAQWQYLY